MPENPSYPSYGQTMFQKNYNKINKTRNIPLKNQAKKILSLHPRQTISNITETKWKMEPQSINSINKNS
jgi:hypothetical protein